MLGAGREPGRGQAGLKQHHDRTVKVLSSQYANLVWAVALVAGPEADHELYQSL